MGEEENRCQVAGELAAPPLCFFHFAPSTKGYCSELSTSLQLRVGVSINRPLLCWAAWS